MTQPLVSVVLATCDRPQLLPVALKCYRRQTYGHKELIVVDDGDRFPADPAAVRDAGGRLIRAAPGTLLGTKLNLGVQEARGSLCQKMDDDDWYAPDFLSSMVGELERNRQIICRPSLGFISPFLFFDVRKWEIRRSAYRNVPGATLMFAREDWLVRPFRDVCRDEDVWFLMDQSAEGATPVFVSDSELFLAVRHRGSQVNRSHTWTHQGDGRTLEDFVADRPLHKSPEEILPDWALNTYRELQRECLGNS